jgi:glucose/arabinose dehydrogenase
MTNVEGMTKTEIRTAPPRLSVIRHLSIPSSFVIRASSLVLLPTSLFAQAPPAPINADWKADAPGVRHKFTVADLPAPYATESANNGPREVGPPNGAQPKVPPGFKIEQYASGFSYPRYLLTAPNGDIFVTESRENSIKVLRDTNADGKPDATETFAASGMNKPFGIAFYPPGPDPQFLYVANTDGVIRFPYRNGDLKGRGPAEKLNAGLSGGGLLRGGGHWTRDIAFSSDGKRCTSRSARALMSRTIPPKPIERAFSSSTRMARAKTFLPGGFATRSASRSDRARTSFG